MMIITAAAAFLLVVTAVTQAPFATANIVISEIASKGSSGVCAGEDWLELFNSGPNSISLSGYILHDDNGRNDTDAFTFPASSEILSEEYLLVCTQGPDPLTSPQFKIGGDDTISLVDPLGETVAVVGPLPEFDSSVDVTYALISTNATNSTYMYTTMPTPGAANVLVLMETPAQRRARLARQNDEGTRFFGMDDRGFPVVDAYDAVLDFYVEMAEEDYNYLWANQSYEIYRPFQSARIVQRDGTELLSLMSPGRIRTKGQSSLYIGTCLGNPAIPFQIDLDHTNKTQTLFGVEKLYLRNHIGDNSYMRDWSSHRMLARFSLPHLRARKVNFYLNGQKTGLYTLLEAPDQEYVFARNFPNFNLESYTLYKVKTLSLGCGLYSDEQLALARSRINETSAPPYSFERGEHRMRVPFLGFDAVDECIESFFTYFGLVEYSDMLLAYVRNNEDCRSMLINEGLIERDLGGKEWDHVMEVFIGRNLVCELEDWPDCGNPNLDREVDVDQWLKNFAMCAVTLNGDSPFGNGNNYYLAQIGDGMGWKIQQYDHNLVASGVLCNAEVCNQHLPDWSIVRPTCESLESNPLVGPLLTNATLHAKYIEYVREFTTSVIGNASFIEELVDHAQAIRDDVAQDFWSFGGMFFDAELTPDASEWNSTGDPSIPQAPFLPLLKARNESVHLQLAALDAGTFPRGPHLAKGVEPWETCVDWRTTGPPDDTSASVTTASTESPPEPIAPTESPEAQPTPPSTSGGCRFVRNYITMLGTSLAMLSSWAF